MKIMLKLGCVLSLLICGVQNSFSQTTSWKGTISINWTTATNWTNGIPTAATDVVLGDVNFTGTYQPKIANVATCKSLTVGGVRAVTLTIANTVTIAKNFIINTNAKVIHQAFTANIAGNWTNNGVYSATATATRIILNGTNQLISGTTSTIFRRLTINAGCYLTLGANIKADSSGSAVLIYGTIDPGQSPTYKFTSTLSTKVYNLAKLNVNAPSFAANYTFTGTFTIYAGSLIEYGSTTTDQVISSAYTYSTLIISGTGTKSLAANLPSMYGTSATYGNIYVNGGTFDLKTFTANRATTRVGGILNVANGACLRIGGLSNFPLNFSSRILNVFSTVEYAGVTQTVSTQKYGTLLISSAGIKTAAVALNITGSLLITNGTFNTNSGIITDSIGGDFIMTGGTLTGTNTSFLLNGTADQSLSLLSNLLKLNIKKVSGNVNLGSDITVTNTLNMIKGNIVTGNYKVILPATSALTGAGQTTGWINGNLEKNVAIGSAVTKTFEVGDANYTPVSVVFTSVSAAGMLTANARLNNYSEMDYSGLDPAKSANHYWAITNTTIAFTTASVTFNWLATDVDAGATTANFKTGLFNGSTWSLVPIAAPGVTSIQATNLTAFGYFSVGEKIGRTTWTGNALTSDWFTSKNWLGLLPSILVPTYITNGIGVGRVYPVLAGGTGIVKDITVDNAAALTISSTTLKVSGIITSNATINASAGTVEFNGATAQSVAAGTFTNNIIKNLTVTNNLSLAGATVVTGTISVANGKTLSTNDNLTLRSTALGTARISALTVNGSGIATAFVTGKVSIERYIPARKAWRLLSTPIKTANVTTITEAWQEDAYISSFAPNPNPYPGYGVHITGGPQSKGFDQSLTNNPTLKYYDFVSNGFIGIPQSPGTFIPLNTYPGYLMYIRGDRSIDLSQGANAAVTSTTLRMKGQINTGNQVSAVGATNFTVLGNPFPSPINFRTITKSNVKNSFYAWDPKLTGVYGLGGYVTVSWNSSTNAYDVTGAASPISEYIPSGEAILVSSLDGINPGTLTVKESDKTASGSDFTFGRPAATGKTLRVNLYPVINGKPSTLIDGVLTTYDDAESNAVDRNDIKTFTTDGGIVSLKRNSSFLAIERRKAISQNDTTFLNIRSLHIQPYMLEIVSENLEVRGFTALLKDKFSVENNNRILNQNGSSIIPFEVTADPASYAADRFSIVFINTEQGTMLASTAKLAKQDKQIEKLILPDYPLSIYPNPVQDKALLQMANLEKGMYTLAVLNMTGQPVKRISLQHNGGALNYNLQLSSELSPGKYQVTITGANMNYATSMIKE